MAGASAAMGVPLKITIRRATNMHGRLLLGLGISTLLSFAMAQSTAHATESDDLVVKEGPKFPLVGNDDIFGFTTPTELGETGDIEVATENDGRFGKRQGSYGALNTKLELSYVVNSDLWIAASGFTSRSHLSNVFGFSNRNAVAFDGFSFEIARRLITRSETNPWGVTISIEPRWGRVDSESGFSSNSYGMEGKFFIDRVLVPDRVFWAANVVWAPQWSQDPFVPSTTVMGSTDTLSTAVTWQISPGIYLGAEARYIAQFGHLTPSQIQGQAVFAGPTFLWKLNDKISFNATIQPQVWGRSNASSDKSLDLDNFERALFRLKLAWQLN